MTTIYFIRHAHSDYTPDEYNRPLSNNGKLESIKLIKLFEHLDIEAMYSSKYLRAVETIHPIALIKNLSIQQEESLNERRLAATPVDDFSNAIVKVWSDPSFAFDGGESNKMAQDRVIPTINSLLNRHPSKNIIIGTHGNILTLILNYFDSSYGLDFWRELTMPDVIKVVFQSEQLISVEKIQI